MPARQETGPLAALGAAPSPASDLLATVPPRPPPSEAFPYAGLDDPAAVEERATIVPTVLTDDTDSDDQTSYVTASVSPNGYPLVAVFCHGRGAPALTTPTCSGLGETWSEEVSVEFVQGSNHQRITIFSADGVGATPGAVTFDLGATTADQGTWAVIELVGAEAPAVVQAASDGGEDSGQNPSQDAIELLVRMASFTRPVHNAALFFVATQDSRTITAEDGFSELFTPISQEGGTFVGFYRIGDDGPSAQALLNLDSNRAAAAVEIAAGPPVVDAEVAAATGTANNPSPSIAPQQNVASGAGTANTPAASIAGSGGVATGSGQAGAPGATISPTAGVASGAGTANNATVAVAKNVDAGAAAGAGTANATAASIAGGSGASAASGQAGGPAPGVAPTASAAAGTGTANDATVQTSKNADAEAASGAGVSNAAAASIAGGSGASAASGQAGGPAPGVAPTASAAAGAGTANDATVQVSGGATVFPASATGSGTALDGSPSVAPGSTAGAGSGAAQGVSGGVSPSIPAAASTGTAGSPGPSVAGTGGAATGSGAASPPGSGIFPTAAPAVGVGTALNATVVIVSVAGDPGHAFAGSRSPTAVAGHDPDDDGHAAAGNTRGRAAAGVR